MKKNKKIVDDNDAKINSIETEVENLIEKLRESQDKEQRSLADYQNLVRRTKEDRLRIIKFATKDFISDLIQPLDHLSLASNQINDAGLNMVVSQLWKVLEANGLKKIDCIGKKFNIETMEVVEKGEKGEKVVKIAKEGYILNDEVIQHAKVILD